MPLRLTRYQQTQDIHYITFTCYHRAPNLSTPAARELYEQTLERVRRWYGFYINAYAVMPEHVHLLKRAGYFLQADPRLTPGATIWRSLRELHHSSGSNCDH